MRLTYTLLVVSLHKINKLVCFAAPLNTRQAFDLCQSGRASTDLSTALWPGRLLTLLPRPVWTQLESGLDLKMIFLWFQSYSVTSALWNTTSFWLFRTAFSSKADNNTDTFQQWLIKCWCRELCVPLVSDSWCLHLGRDWINPTQRE